jgi:hypothetical protein
MRRNRKSSRQSQERVGGVVPADLFPGTRDATAAVQKHQRSSEVILATEVAMLFLYLPFIIFEALMFGPHKRNMRELDAA